MVQVLKPAVVMVVVQMAYAGSNVLYKLAFSDGMDLFATAFIASLALLLERKERPKMTWKILFQAFLCGFFGGTVSQNLYLEAIDLSSATLASAMNNSTPAITFIMGVSFRLEKLSLRTAAGKGKIIGTIIAISGAMILTLFKGIEINTGSFHVTLLHHPNGHVATPQSSSGIKTLLGALCSLGCSCAFALWLIIQAKMARNYPCHYTSVTLNCLSGAISSVVFALCLDRDWTQWKLGWNVRLLTVAYTGIVISGAVTVAIAWCVDLRGPLFVSAFNPLALALVAIAGFFMLDEKIYLGSIIGGVLIVCGVYAVLWGKGKEMKMNQTVPPQGLHEITVIRSPTRDTSAPHDSNSDDADEIVIDNE